MVNNKINYPLSAVLVIFLAVLGLHYAAAATPGDLVKASASSVYYLGADNKRYVFPNEKIYFSWYADFSGVKTITNQELATYAIGGNVTYKPGVRLVKIVSDPKVYAVSAGGILRWVPDEATANAIYGANWRKTVDDLPDSFFVNYKIGVDIDQSHRYDRVQELATATDIGIDKKISNPQVTQNNSNVSPNTNVVSNSGGGGGGGAATPTPVTYTISYAAGANGTLTGSVSQTVNSGGNGTAVTAVPATGYHFVNWSDSSSTNPRTDANVTANLTVTANFAINTYTLTYNHGAHGTISGSTPQTVNYGASGTQVTAVPDANYHFVNWSDLSTSNPRTDTNVSGNITITANFALTTPSYTLTYSAGSHGSLTGTTSQTVNSGGNGTAVTAVPATGYHFVNWSDSSTANPRTDANVTANLTVTANFFADSVASCATAPLRTSSATADHGYGTIHYFCSNGGSDSNDGLSPGTPKASWSSAISTFNSMPAGDTVALCRGGSWATSSTNNIYNQNCRANSTCDFRDYGSGNAPAISFSGHELFLFNASRNGHDEGYRWWNIRVDNATGNEFDWNFGNDLSDVDICNVDVHGGNIAILEQGGVAGQARNNRFTVRNSNFSNVVSDALLVASSNFTVDSNVFTNVGSSATCPSGGMFCHAIYFEEEDIGPRSEANGMETQNLRITNNTFTMDSSTPCGSSMIHIAGRQNNGLVENNYFSAMDSNVTNSCIGIGAGGSGYSTASWFRAMTYRRNRIFFLAQSGPSQGGISLDGHGTIVSDVSGQSVYTLGQAVPPAVVADNIIVVGGPYPAGISYAANTSAANPKGDVTSGIITYNNSIYLPNAEKWANSPGITTGWSGGSGGNNYVMQNNAIYGPDATCITNPDGFAPGRSTPNYCRTLDGATNGLSTDALGAVWIDAVNGDFSLPPGSPLIGAGSATYFDPYAISPTQTTWTPTDLPETRTAPIDIGAVSSH